MTTLHHYLAAAQWHYRTLGYTPIDVPWFTDPEIQSFFPKCSQNAGGFLATPEQGFVKLAHNGILVSGRYQTLTPCATAESLSLPAPWFHTKQFTSLSLLDYESNATENMGDWDNRMARMAEDAVATIHILTEGRLQLRDTPAEDKRSLTIEAQCGHLHVPIASFGIKTAPFGTWVHGTGLIEPRFSKILQAAGLPNIPTLSKE